MTTSMKRTSHHVYLLLLFAWAAVFPAVLASVIGFDSTFTSASSPYAITECDAACTSPSFVTFQLKLVRSGSPTATDTVYVSTRPPSDSSQLEATSGDDYTALSEVAVVFAPSESVKTVAMTVISDGVYEEDERFEAVIGSPSSGVTLSDATRVAYIKIQDGGDAGIFAFSDSTYTFAENAGLVHVKVVRTGGASGVVKVTYRLSNPTQSTAISTKSFLLTDSVYQLTFVENQREALIPIKIINDAVYESKEFFYLELSALSPMKLSDSKVSVAKHGTKRTAAVFIADDGDAGQFDFTSAFIFCREDNGSAVVSIVRSLGSSSSSYTPVTLTVATVGVNGGSNATEGGSLAFDYLAATNKLQWANGETRKTFPVKIFNNKKYEPQTRAFKILMTAVEGGATIGPQISIWVYIVDDRDAGTLSFKKAQYEVLENAGTVAVEVTRTGLTDSSGVNSYASGVVTVDVATYAGTIVPGLDKYDLNYDNGVVKTRKCTHMSPCTATADVAYTVLASTTLTFGDGETVKTVYIPILDDTLFEAPDQVFKVILQNATGGAHIGIDYEHPGEWESDRAELLALDKRRNELLDNVGTIVTIKDDGDPAVLVSKASLSLSEIGQQDAFDVWLNALPTGDVDVTFTYDTAALTMVPSSLTFTAADYSSRQKIKVSAFANNRTQGLPRSDIKVVVTSADPAYNAPYRPSLASASGFVLGSTVFTQKPGTYDTGNSLHAFPWVESAGVMTSPQSTAIIAAFVLDDDPAGIILAPETIRHGSQVASFLPVNHIAVRLDGHNATVGVSLSSEPAGDVDVTFVVATGAKIDVSISTLTFTPANWNVLQAIQVFAVPSAQEIVYFSRIEAFASSVSDPKYNQSKEPMAVIHVARYPSALVLLDASVLTTRENDLASVTKGRASYELRLGSEPMHWEPDANEPYTPFELILRGNADTTLTLSDDSPIAATAAGFQTTFTAASNASTSSSTTQMMRVGVVRFTVAPAIVSATGSHQVGAAKLRMYRLSGGENGGLGGISVGVAVADGEIAANWDEATLRALCSSDANAQISCQLPHAPQATPLPLSELFPATTNTSTLSALTAGSTVIQPAGSFDATTNAYIAAPGWVEIDITVALNAFLSQQQQLQQAQQPYSRDLSLLVYTTARPSFFVYDGVTEVVFASKDHKDSTLRPQLSVIGSGRVNLATASATTVSQSHTGSAKAAVDGKTTSKLGVASTFAMALTPYKYPWWEADLGASRLIDDVVVTIKSKVPSASFTAAQLPVSIWLMLSDTKLSANNKGLAGFTSSQAATTYAKQFTLTTRAFTSSESDTIVLRWRVFGSQGDTFYDDDHFHANFSTTIHARYLLLQVEGENNIALNEVEIYQPALASARVSLGGFIPSPSVVRKSQNQIEFRLDQPGGPDETECDSETQICRRELLFSSGNWWQPQTIQVGVVDDAVATGDRDVMLTHTLQSGDPAFIGSFGCEKDGTTCASPNLFNDSSVKILHILDDDENAVLFSASELEVVEGSSVSPNARVARQARRVYPSSVRCSSDATTVISVAGGGGSSCATAFRDSQGDSPWQTCITDSKASVLAAGSAWIMAGFLESDINVTEISLTIPKMSGDKYIRAFSLWWSDTLDLNTSSMADLLNISHSWTKINAFDVQLTSSGPQTIHVPRLALASIKVLLLSLDKSYDDITNCLVAPQIAIRANVAVPFPIAIRGDLTSADSVAPSESKRSRMHEVGRAAPLQVRLASEPIEDVIVSVVMESKNAAVSVYDATNKPNSPSASTLIGGKYESGEIVDFEAPTALRFSAKNWNVPQAFTFLAVDDNIWNGNRTFSISHVATSTDVTASAIPAQTFLNGNLTRGFTTLAPSLAYKAAPFIVSDARASSWPTNWTPRWTSVAGTVKVAVIDDDLPGVTLSQSTVVISESASEPGNYSIALDSAPTADVVVTISYEADASLLTVAPLQLTFTPTNWKTPQFVFIDPTPNDVYDAGAPFAIDYNRLVAKKTQPLLLHTVSSAHDSVYNGIAVGGNEFDRNTAYVLNQGVVAVVQDDDTGCTQEYTCLNGGTCINTTHGESLSSVGSASVCQCPATYGMKDCAASCTSARDCAFSRIEFHLECRPGDATAICGDTFSPSRLVATLYRMLTANEFTSSSGKLYTKLGLGAMAEAMYIVNSTTAPCSAGSSATCVNVVLDTVKEIGTTADPIVDKLQGFLESGSLQAQPIFAELMSSKQQYPQSIGATVTVWVFLGFCLASIGGVATLFSLRFVKLKKFHVQPQLDDDPKPIACGVESVVPPVGSAAHGHAQ